jgi:peptidoglycan/xylan/chitin deacetylase (PgdA/CDA1 family)
VTPRLALTFDDGPDPDDTPALLELLARHASPATFFVWGEQAERFPEVVKATIAAGHAVQPHCWAHRSHNELSAAELRADIDRVTGLLAELGAPAPTLWRPPYGHVNGRATERVARERGLALTGWTIDSLDYRGTAAGEMREAVTRALAEQRRGLAVLLAHDSAREPGQQARRADASQTRALVQALLGERRYEPVALARGLRAGLDYGSRRSRARAAIRRLAPER